ncbi:MAG: flagellar export chaperone FliS [Clostridiaceae bacterium]|nr:flagellar export chaperone FliS [Clostridiaceae bacterium]
MAINNPYAAYKRFSTNPQIDRRKVQEKSNAANVTVTNSSPNPLAQNHAGKLANHYLENAVMTATPEELTLMLYDGAIKFMNQAVVHIQMKNIQGAHNAIIRAQDIFSELMSSLNMEYEVSKGLYSLYDFIYSSLIQANLSKDAEQIREMISLTRELRETWAQAIKIARKG